MSKANMPLRIYVIRNGLTYTDVANEIGYNRCSLSRLLSKKVSKEKEALIRGAVDRLVQKRKSAE